MIEMLDERKGNRSYLAIKSVMSVIRETHTMKNGVQLGRLIDGEQHGVLELVMLAHAKSKPESANPWKRNGIFDQQNRNYTFSSCAQESDRAARKTS